MKKLIKMIIVLVGVFCVSSTAYADSPVTSTNFSRAYYHIDIVEEASRKNIITADMAAYLADVNNPIDVKAAIINALSWDTNGKSNAELYCQFIYGKELEKIDVATLSGDQQFCIGYLLAMDDIYFETTQSMDYLRMARDNMKESLTVALVTCLVEMMNVEFNDWPVHINQILADSSLNQDMSEDAIKEITDYMLLGIDKPVNIPKTGIVPIGMVYGMGAILFLILAFVLMCSKRSGKVLMNGSPFIG